MSQISITIEQLYYSKLINARFSSLVNGSVQYPAKFNMPAEHPVMTALSYFTPQVDLFNAQMGKENEYSERKNLDDKVDDSWTFMVSMLETHENGVNPARKAAAVGLNKVFDTFDKGLHRLSFASQYTMLGPVIDIWETPENLAHLDTLHLTEDFEALRSHFGAFVNYSVDNNTTNDNLPSTRELRTQIFKCYTLWLGLLESMANLNQDALCYEVLSSINKLIKEQSTYLKSKATRREEGEE